MLFIGWEITRTNLICRILHILRVLIKFKPQPFCCILQPEAFKNSGRQLLKVIRKIFCLHLMITFFLRLLQSKYPFFFLHYSVSRLIPPKQRHLELTTIFCIFRAVNRNIQENACTVAHFVPPESQSSDQCHKAIKQITLHTAQDL